MKKLSPYSSVKDLPGVGATREKQLEKLDTVFDNFRAAYEAAKKQLNDDTAEFLHSDLRHAVGKCVTERYPWYF